MGHSELWLLLPGLALLLAIVLLIVLLTLSEWQKILNEVEATSITTADILAKHSDRLLETADLVRIQVAEIVGDGAVTADRGHFEQIVRLTRAVPDVTSIWIGDAEGTAILTSREFPTPSVSAADREHFTVVRDDPDALFIGKLIDDQYSEEVQIRTTRRLPADDGTFRGYIQVSLSAGQLRQSFHLVQLPYHTSLWLIGPEGQPLLREPSISFETMARAIPDLAIDTDAGSGHFSTTSKVDGSEIRFYYSRSTHYGTSILVGVGEAELMSMWRSRVLPIVLFGALLIAALLAILIFIRRERLSNMRYAAQLERDVLDRTAELNDAVEERGLMLQEMQHRVRNTFAAIQGLTNHMLRGSKSLEALKRDFPGRLSALAATQVLLVSSEDRQSASLEDIVWTEIGPYRSKGDSQIIVEGPSIRLHADKVTLMGLALHELATNAVKYGALSAPEGRLIVRWTRDHNGMLNVQWVEEGAHLVARPNHRGFGTELLERSAKLLGGQIEWSFEPGRLRVTVQFRA
jgi:two-component sensor histidine kinase